MKKNKLLLLGLLFVVACSTSQKHQAPQTPAPRATDKAVKEYREALNLYKTKKYPEALKKLARFTQVYSKTDLTDDAYYLIGQIYFDQNNFFKAGQFWQAIIDGQTFSEYHDRAAVGAALSHYQLNHLEDATKALDKYVFNPESTDHSLGAQAYELSSKIKLSKKQFVAALKDLLFSMSLKKQTTDLQSMQFKANDIVKSYFTQDQLNEIVGQADFEKVDAVARLKLGTLLYDQKSWPAARTQFQIIQERYPGTEFAVKSLEYLALIDSQNRVDSGTIGVVLPLTGKYASQGYKVLRGIQMATQVFNSSSIKLAVVDSEGNPDIAKKAVDRLVSEDHVIAIIGDVAGKTAHAVAARAQELGVPCLTLSQKQGLTEIGDFIFRNNITPDMQMRTLATTAINLRGLKRFAILYPNDTYGTEYATAFWDYVLLNGGEVVAAQTYSPEETDFREAIQRMVGTYFIEEDRGKEYQIRINEWKKNQKPKTAREKPPKDLMPPVVDFDAIFIPDGAKSLGQISSMLVYNDISNVALLGTNLWNSTQTATRAAKFAESTLFVDEPSANSSSGGIKRFNSDFQNIFGYLPDIFEVQGYDSAVIIMRGLQSSSDRKSLRDQLASISKITGARGPLTMGPSREIEKSLLALTIKDGQIVKADN